MRYNLYIISLPVLCVKCKVYQTGLVLLPSTSQTILRKKQFPPSFKHFRIFTELYNHHNNLTLAHFHHTKNKSHVHLPSLSSPTPNPRQPFIYYLSLYVCLFGHCIPNALIQYIFFYICLLALNIIFEVHSYRSRYHYFL